MKYIPKYLSKLYQGLLIALDYNNHKLIQATKVKTFRIRNSYDFIIIHLHF